MSRGIDLKDVTHRTLGYGSILEWPRVSFQLSIDKDEFVSNLEPFYKSWLDEHRSEDEQFGVSEDLLYMNELGYPSLRELLEHPDEFNDFFCDYARDAFFEFYANADDVNARWCINEIIYAEVTEDTVNLLAVVFDMSGIQKLGAFPEFIVDGELPLGIQILSALHASMAWQLGWPELSSLCGGVQFPSSAFTVVPSEKLSAITQGVVLKMTESSLGNRSTVIVRLPEGYSEPFSPKIPSGIPNQHGPKMYVLMREGMPPEAMMSLGSTAVVNCYNQFQDLPEVREWATGVFKKVICKASSSEIRAAMRAKDFVALDSPEYGFNVAIAFAPRSEWPPIFRSLKLLR